MWKVIFTKSKQITVLGIVAMLGLSFVQPTVSALSAKQKQLIDSGSAYVDLNTTGPCKANGVAGLTLDQQIAQLLWVGFDGSANPDTVKSVVTGNNVGGIFFTVDFDVSKVNKEFFAGLVPINGNKLLIAADDEGGRVKTFSKTTPSAAEMTNLPIEQIRTWGKTTGKAMADAGLNANLAPVLDIQTPGTLWTQTQRDWSSDPGQVHRRAGTFAAGLKEAGITPVYKHFPGIGKIGANGAQPNNTDTGATAPQSLSNMANDLVPYESLIKGKSDGSVMLSNGFINEWDGGNVPVSISPAAVNYLRTTLNYQGMITTDALNSLANYGSKAMDLPNAVASSLAAGVDMPLFVVSGSTADKTVKDIITAVKAKNIPQATLDAAYKKSLAMRGVTNGAAPATGPNANPNASSSQQCCDTTTAGGGSVSGSGQVEIIMNYLLQQGFTVAGAAAAIGNMKVESSPNLKPNIQQGGSTWPKGGWGLIQWTGGRRITLVDFITKPPYNLSRLYVEDKSSELNLSAEDNGLLMKAELDFMFKELTESYQSTLNIGKTATEPKKAAADWELAFEGCSPTWGLSGCDVPLRQQYAQEIFDQFNGKVAPAAGSGTTPAATSSGSSCTGGVNGGSATGENALQPPAGGVGTSVYYYNQCDPQWTQKGNGYDYCGCACGQSSTATILSSLKGDPNITPISVYTAIGDSGSQGSGKFDPSSCAGSSIFALLEYIKSQGLQTAPVQERGNGGLDSTKAFNEIKQGHLLLVHTSKWVGYFSKNATSGHYLVIYAADANGQNFYVMNPGSSGDKGKPIPASGITDWLDEAYAVWK